MRLRKSLWARSLKALRRGSQVVRQRSAKPLFAGSIPARASVKDLCRALTDDIPSIVSRWLAYVDREPWSKLSEADRLDDLPRFLTTLFAELSAEDKQAAVQWAFLDAAATHGDQRRRLGFGYDHIMEESALLRRAMWGFDELHRYHVHDMVKVDAALTVGLLASLRGYAKPELMARGEWNSSLVRLATDWGSLFGS